LKNSVGILSKTHHVGFKIRTQLSKMQKY